MRILVLVTLLALPGCVAYPTGYAYVGGGPVYVAPAPVVVAPVYPGWGWRGGWHGWR